MTRLFFDIETIPCSEENREKFVEIMRAKNVGKSDEVIFESMSFDGGFGRLCCIGYIKENELGKIDEGVLSGDEKEILQKFWEISKDVDQFIGHNVFEFDFPFIYKRSRVLGVYPRHDISFARYRQNPIYDTMKEWNLWGIEKVKLDVLSKIFGLQTSKDDMNGSEVWKYFQEGKIEEICTYCMKDVVLTREVFYKMIVRELPKDKPTKENLF